MVGLRLTGFHRTLTLMAVIFVTTGGLAGCSDGTTSSGDIAQVNPTTNVTRFQGAGRSEAPELSGATITGAFYKTSYMGHVTVINIWGSWCTHCREEAASLAEASKAYAPKGVRFIGIDAADNDAAARSYASSFGIAYPSLADPDEKLLLDLRSLVPAEGVPSTLIVDENGKVAVRMIGGITEPELDQQVDYVLQAG